MAIHPHPIGVLGVLTTSLIMQCSLIRQILVTLLHSFYLHKLRMSQKKVLTQEAFLYVDCNYEPIC